MKFLDRLFGGGGNDDQRRTSALDERMLSLVDTSVSTPPHPPHEACEKCGGFFRPEDLQDVCSITVYVNNGSVGQPCFKKLFYCQVCNPGASLILTLRFMGDDLCDQRYFRVEDGWFQDVDDDRELRHVISSEEFSRLYCIECGDYTHEQGVECKSCVKQHKTARGKK